MPNTDKKSRFFAFMSYLTKEQILDVIYKKATSIRAYAIIDHNKDEAEPHRHFVLRTNGSWTAPQINKWFDGQTDENGKKINTFCEIVHDRTAICDYLTHKNDPDKHQYDESDIIDGGLYDIRSKGETADDTYEIIEKMAAGTSTREMVRLYGRDFVYHYGSYAMILQQIKEEEG